MPVILKLVKHINIEGSSGMGKSTLLLNIFSGHIKAGFPAGLVDPHGDLADAAVQLRDARLKEHADKAGATPLLKQIDVAERKINELTAELKQLGFYLDATDGLSLYGDANPLDKIIDAEIKKAVGTERDIDARFDAAQVAMMTVATLQDAHAFLESVQKI
jgi:gamma-glutamyl phosphate reductase